MLLKPGSDRRNASESEEARRATEARSRAYLTAALDCVVMADANGRVLEFNPAAESTFGYTREEALGRTLAELIVPPSLRERHQRAFDRFVETREATVFGRRLELTAMRADGSEFPVELSLSLVEGEPLLICGALRDISARKKTDDDLRRLAEAQAALRRVATLVAERTRPDQVFAAVANEVGHVLDVPMVEMVRFNPDSTATVIADLGEVPYPVGTTWKVDGPSVTALVLKTGRPARIDDYSRLPGNLAQISRDIGLQSSVGAPILLEGRVWGAILAASTDRVLPAETEVRLVDFTVLVATAISDTQAQDDLLASRARIVAAGDEARRRIERNLHDGTQQRLVSLGLDLQALKNHVPSGLDVASRLDDLTEELDSIIDDVREISRGLHPALLSHAGLGPALRALARKSSVPVELQVRADERYPESIEITVYYVVSEALANAAKHAAATLVEVSLDATRDSLRATISDDGVGGAVWRSGAGLVGLVDRVAAQGGHFSLDSPPGQGTTISIDLPLADASVELPASSTAVPRTTLQEPV